MNYYHNKRSLPHLNFQNLFPRYKNAKQRTERAKFLSYAKSGNFNAMKSMIP